MKKTLQASLSAVLVLSLAGCKSTAASVSSTQSAQNNTFYQDAIDAYVNEVDMDYAYDFTKTFSYFATSSTCTSLSSNKLRNFFH